MDLVAQKTAFRRRMRRMRAAVTRDILRAAARSIAENLATLPPLATASTVATYLAIRREIPTSPAREALPHVRWAIPRIEANTMVMVEDAGPRVEGAFGIPTGSGPAIPVDAVLVPGLAFDGSGRRLGWGGGFYDRYLAANKVFSIGLALDEAIVDDVPHDVRDQRVDLVVTPTQILRPAKD
ncbi:MAG: 5-formyltetrahydrofolate cyclo-ligase [Myxococcota bacterium]